MCDHQAVAGLDVEIQAHAGQAILVLHGELDMATEAQLHDVAVAQLAGQGVAKLGLDLTDITFLDSTGVTALLDLRKRANDRGIDLQILAVSRGQPAFWHSSVSPRHSAYQPTLTRRRGNQPIVIPDPRPINRLVGQPHALRPNRSEQAGETSREI